MQKFKYSLSCIWGEANRLPDWRVPSGAEENRLPLSKIIPKERIQLVEGDHIHAVIEVGVIGAGNDQQLLVLAGELFVDTLAEIAGVRLFSMHQQNGGTNFGSVLQDRQDNDQVHQYRQCQ